MSPSASSKPSDRLRYATWMRAFEYIYDVGTPDWRPSHDLPPPPHLEQLCRGTALAVWRVVLAVVSSASIALALELAGDLDLCPIIG
eukprot:scaffold6732_cov99-Isochrysis_galbana.AAC.1